jgi:hypothetical protein
VVSLTVTHILQKLELRDRVQRSCWRTRRGCSTPTEVPLGKRAAAGLHSTLSLSLFAL